MSKRKRHELKMLNKARPLSGAVKSRVGEGVPINVIRHPQTQVGGGIMQQITIDLSTASVPDRRYPANIGSLLVSNEKVQWLFGQRNVVGEGLLSLLVVNVPFLATRQFLHAMKPLIPNAKAYVERHKVPRTDLANIKAMPEHAVMLDANIVAAGISAREGCLDFYNASPFVVASVGQGGDFFADPVVRVTLSLSLLVAITDALEARKESLPADDMEGQL